MSDGVAPHSQRTCTRSIAINIRFVHHNPVLVGFRLASEAFTGASCGVHEERTALAAHALEVFEKECEPEQRLERERCPDLSIGCHT